MNKPFDLAIFAGLPIAVTNLNEASDELVAWTSERRGSLAVHLVNAYTISLTRNNTEYFNLLGKSSASLPDGRPIQSLSRLFGTSRLRQVRGPELFTEVLRKGQGLGIRHYFLGGTEEHARELVRSVERDFPNANVAGSQTPPFRTLSELEWELQLEEIKKTKPDILWVGLGTPKQDFEVARFTAVLDIPVVAIGAAFGFQAGTLREAPMWVKLLALEWLFRLVQEPKRLWKRYLVGNLVFLYLVAMRKSP
jgi:N-acetylglucosaminyldiphosphoundecaprenol N-acetyl-beta-D-mannosaminyltransferase